MVFYNNFVLCYPRNITLVITTLILRKQVEIVEYEYGISFRTPTGIPMGIKLVVLLANLFTNFYEVELNFNHVCPSDETVKTEVPCHSRCGMILKILPCSKALNALHRPTFCSPSPSMLTSLFE